MFRILSLSAAIAIACSSLTAPSVYARDGNERTAPDPKFYSPPMAVSKETIPRDRRRANARSEADPAAGVGYAVTVGAAVTRSGRNLGR